MQPLNHTIAKLADDPFLDQYSLLVFSRLSVEPLMSGCEGWSAEDDKVFNQGRQDHYMYHKNKER